MLQLTILAWLPSANFPYPNVPIGFLTKLSARSISHATTEHKASPQQNVHLQSDNNGARDQRTENSLPEESLSSSPPVSPGSAISWSLSPTQPSRSEKVRTAQLPPDSSKEVPSSGSRKVTPHFSPAPSGHLSNPRSPSEDEEMVSF